MFSVAVLVPSTEAEKETTTEVCPSEATLEAGAVVIVKSAALIPESEYDEMFRDIVAAVPAHLGVELTFDRIIDETLPKDLHVPLGRALEEITAVHAAHYPGSAPASAPERRLPRSNPATSAPGAYG